jgi:hypothetical protein
LKVLIRAIKDWNLALNLAITFALTIHLVHHNRLRAKTELYSQNGRT